MSIPEGVWAATAETDPRGALGGPYPGGHEEPVKGYAAKTIPEAGFLGRTPSSLVAHPGLT